MGTFSISRVILSPNRTKNWMIKSIFETQSTQKQNHKLPNSKALNQIYRFIYYRISYIDWQLENPKIQHVIDKIARRIQSIDQRDYDFKENHLRLKENESRDLERRRADLSIRLWVSLHATPSLPCLFLSLLVVDGEEKEEEKMKMKMKMKLNVIGGGPLEY